MTLPSTNYLPLTIFFFLIFSFNIQAQYSTDAVELEGKWELEIEGEDKNAILIIEPRTGPIAIGTFQGLPVIINVNGSNINFVCDKKKKGKRERVRFIGSSKDSKISGKMYFHPGNYVGKYVEWKASKQKKSSIIN